MAIEYLCSNCGERFKIREYMCLEVSQSQDDKDDQSPKRRKCKYCGNDISIEGKSITV